MNKYKVSYTAYDNDYWKHRYGVEIVEADTPEQAEEIVTNKSNHFEEYIVDKIELFSN